MKQHYARDIAIENGGTASTDVVHTWHELPRDRLFVPPTPRPGTSASDPATSPGIYPPLRRRKYSFLV